MSFEMCFLQKKQRCFPLIGRMITRSVWRLMNFLCLVLFTRCLQSSSKHFARTWTKCSLRDSFERPLPLAVPLCCSRRRKTAHFDCASTIANSMPLQGKIVIPFLSFPISLIGFKLRRSTPSSTCVQALIMFVLKQGMNGKLLSVLAMELLSTSSCLLVSLMLLLHYNSS